MLRILQKMWIFFYHKGPCQTTCLNIVYNDFFIVPLPIYFLNVFFC